MILDGWNAQPDLQGYLRASCSQDRRGWCPTWPDDPPWRLQCCVGLPDDRTTRTRSYILSDRVGREHDKAGEADRIKMDGTRFTGKNPVCTHKKGLLNIAQLSCETLRLISMPSLRSFMALACLRAQTVQHGFPPVQNSDPQGDHEYRVSAA